MTTPKKPDSRRGRRAPMAGANGVGPENLPADAYRVRIVLRCSNHPRIKMGDVSRSTIPDRQSEGVVITPVPQGGLNRYRGTEEGHRDKFLFVCSECGNERLWSWDRVDKALAEMWEPWARRVETIRL